MHIGQSGRIISIENSELAFGLSTMGLLAGDLFILTDAAPFNGPFALQVGSGKIAIRKHDASKIWVEPIA